MRRLFVVLLFTALVSAQSAPPKPPDLHEVMQRVVQRAKWEKEARLDARYTYRQKRTVDKLDSDGKVTEHTVTLFEVIPVGDDTNFRMIEKNGRPLTADEQRKEAEREAKSRQSLRNARKSHEDDVPLDQELIDRYNFTYLGEELLSGRRALIFEFSPKPGDLPEKRRMDRVLNHLRGKVWIDLATYAISKADVVLTEPVRFFIGLGAVRALHLTVDMSPVDGQWLLPRATAISYDARAFFSTIRVNQHSEYSDYRLVSPSVEKR